MQTSTGELGSLMIAINESEKDTLETARDWMNANEYVIGDWIP